MNRANWRFEDYYFVYSLERVGTVLAQPTEEWYIFGARKLVAAQKTDGRWQSRRGGDEKDAYGTSLALLFLNRATVRSITPGAH